jgi:hypothetical protein
MRKLFDLFFEQDLVKLATEAFSLILYSDHEFSLFGFLIIPNIRDVAKTERLQQFLPERKPLRLVKDIFMA